ncbi:hypothetical protein GT037_003642 [Alternaria burnsii]|uniref:Carboxylesterase family protein n=1 Tax=Alternaria burnsii TaxID=1187904 RepID=A0A8H7EH13_9PLEO|nr:uncharacterized protein GT037_003642 [Alternaria burnsii]KAF7678261.1 hypothetical protein GT037_003642 [Alternaria burnsii]CAI9634216.1 unnamed protein product [Alternaria burnsii]
MRVTRARAQQASDDAPDATERAPLEQISSNASPKHAHYEQEDLPPKTPAKTPAKTPGRKTKGKGRAQKGKKGRAVEEEEEEEQTGAAHEEEQAADAAPTNKAAGDQVSNNAPDGATQVPANHGRPVTPPPTVRRTRRQLAMLQDEAKQAQLSAQSQEPEPVAEVPATIEKTLDEHKAVDASSEDTTADAEQVQAESLSEEPIQGAQLPAAAESVEEAQNVPIEEETHQEVTETVEATHAAPVPQIEEPQSEEPVVEATVTEAISENQSPVSEAEPPAPSVQVSSEPEPKTLAAERPSEDAVTPLKSHTSSRRTSRSPSKSPMRLEESFEAIDALEEALENVTSVTRFDHAHEVMSPQKTEFPKTATTQIMRSKTPIKAPVPTQAPAAKISRTPSVAAPKSMKPVKSSIARASSVRTAPGKDGRVGSTETVDYLALKRRPISMSFPTPAPPPKGRAPTKPTFQLSSNDTVARLKAQKEDRQKREAEGGVSKIRPVSMPPPPKSTKPLTKPAFQLPGEKIAEKLKAQKEERQKREAEVPQQQAPKQRPVSISMAPHAKSTKAPTKATFELPGSAVAEKLRIKREERLKRMEEAEAAKKEAALKARQAPVRKPVAVPIRQQPGITIAPPQPQIQRVSSLASKHSSMSLSQPGVTIAPPQPQQESQRSSSLASKRSSMSLSQPLSQSRSTSTSSANRNSVIVPKAVVTPVDVAQQKLKGREVFNRDRTEKEARERERKEKEEAAKRARAEAAERGRIASREWAERQRKKMMGA